MMNRTTPASNTGIPKLYQEGVFFQMLLLSTLIIEAILLWGSLSPRLLSTLLFSHLALSGSAILLIHATPQAPSANHNRTRLPLQTILILLSLLWGSSVLFFPVSNLPPITLHALFLTGVLFFFLYHVETFPLLALTVYFALITPILYTLFLTRIPSCSLLARGLLAFSLITGFLFIKRRHSSNAIATCDTSNQVHPSPHPIPGQGPYQEFFSGKDGIFTPPKNILPQNNLQTPAQMLARYEAIWDTILTITDQSHLQNCWQNCFSGKLSSLCLPLETDRIYIVDAYASTCYPDPQQSHHHFQASIDHRWVLSSPDCSSMLRKGEIIHSQSPELNQDEKNRLQDLGIQSFVDIPILLKDELWGIIGMDRLTHSTPYTPQQIKGLRFIANILSMIIGSQQDRTERDRLVTVVEQSGDCILITDPDGQILYANPACEHITGFTRQEITGTPLKTLYPASPMVAPVWEMISAAMQKGKDWHAQFTVHRKDHTLYEEEFLLSPVYDQDGKVINQVITKRNITEKKRLESIAEAANLMENIGFIFSSIRHELGNPINSIKVSLSVLDSNLEGYNKNDIKRFINRSLSDIGRVEYLLKTLKNFSIFEHPLVEKTDLTALLNKFITLVDSELKQKDIQLSVSIPQTPLFGLIDPRAFQQVMLNLIANAADALSETSQKCISLSLSKEENGQIITIIRDTGCGISNAEQANLFKPFFTTKEQGTGLGLVIVKKMLSKMNCSINIYSEPNAGTKIHIAIPGS
jgi:PAS domain S-box-containing protein